MVAQETMDVGLPSKMRMYQDGLDLVIVRRWFGVGTIVLTAFAAVWEGFLVFWYRHAPADPTSTAFWFPLLHVGAGVFISYAALAGWVNTTLVRVGQGRLSVKTAPLPFSRNWSLEAATLRQLYAKARQRSNGEGGSSTNYDLHAITNDGRNLKLVSGLDSSEQAVFLEQRIERQLGIQNVPVQGQIP